VKCGQTTLTVECKKPKEQPAKCANSNGDHPASYTGCKIFQDAKKAAQQSNNTNAIKIVKGEVIQNKSYAQATATDTISEAKEVLDKLKLLIYYINNTGVLDAINTTQGNTS